MSVNKKEILKKEELVQAVVIADSYDNQFQPITIDTPRCLLPLAGEPILQYTLTFLKISGVQEAFVYCTAHANKIKEFLASSGWTNSSSAVMSVTVITNEECRSFGDAMRDMDGKGLLRQDFFLVSGHTVSNINLSDVWKQHKERALVDRNASMTLVFKKAAPGHPCRTKGEEVVVATNGKENRILSYQRVKSGCKLNFPLELFEENGVVELNYDLLDPCISICSAAIPPLFADNFDCQTLDGFISGVIENDLLTNTLYMAKLGDIGYAARICNLHTYGCVSRDVLARWVYPLVPERQFGAQFKYHRHNVYKGRNTVLERDSLLERDVLLAPNCTVGEHTTISTSCISAKCKIGKNVNIKDCIIMEGVTIEDGCQLENCVVSNSVRIGANSVVNARCIIGSGVVVPQGTKVATGTRLVAKRDIDDGFSDDEDDGDQVTSSDLGPQALLYRDADQDSDSEDEDEDGDDLNKVIKDFWGLTLNDFDCDHVSSSSEDDDEDEFGDMDHLVGEGEISLMGTDIIDNDEAKYAQFHSEVLDSLGRGAKQKTDPAHLSVEINSSRHAYAVSWSQVVHSVTYNILQIASKTEQDLGGKKLLKEIQSVLKIFGPLLKNYCKSTSAEVDCLYGLEEFSFRHESTFMPVAMKTIHSLYDDDIVSEDAIREWFDNIKEEEGTAKDFAKVIREKVKPLIEWLQEDSDEDESD